MHFHIVTVLCRILAEVFYFEVHYTVRMSFFRKKADCLDKGQSQESIRPLKKIEIKIF